MPTKKKRVGFIPREDVMKIIDKLSEENNLSNSKIISILVEEALSIRGIYNKETCKETQFYQNIEKDPNGSSEECSYFKNNEKFTKNTKLQNQKNYLKTNLIKQVNQDEFDLNTYKKFISFLKFKEMLDEFNN